MRKPSFDAGAMALGLAAIGFCIVLFFANRLAPGAVQPLLAAILVAAGGIGLLISRASSRNRRN